MSQWQPDPYGPGRHRQYAGPREVTTRLPLGFGWTVFHLLMTIGTGGLWGVVWWLHARSRKVTTTIR